MTASSNCLVDLTFLCCPYPDHGNLKMIGESEIECDSCERRFRVVDGRPILFDESRSIFSAEEVARMADKRQFPQKTGWRYWIRKKLPAATSRDVGFDLLARYKDLLPHDSSVLIVGCGFTGDIYSEIFHSSRVFLTDVTLQGDAQIACDGTCLPFPDQSVDCVIIDQVLEHAVEPLNVVDEIYRCLKMDGIVFSGVPCHFPVHGFPFDFQRYTPLGHRMLFRKFQELEFEITQGPISALSLSLIGFFASVSTNLWWRRITSLSIRLLFKPGLWIDRRYAEARGLTLLAASAFLGRKQICPMSIREIIADWESKAKSGAG